LVGLIEPLPTRSSSFAMNRRVNGSLIAAQGHSRAHLVHFWQKSCSPKSILRSGVSGNSLIATVDLAAAK